MPSREEENEVKPLQLTNLPNRADKTTFKRAQCEFTHRLHSERSGFAEVKTTFKRAQCEFTHRFSRPVLQDGTNYIQFSLLLISNKVLIFSAIKEKFRYFAEIILLKC